MIAKEIVGGVPIIRLGDYLKSTIHRVFTVEADYLLGDGMMSESERILLSNQISKALIAFSEGLPDDLATRPLNWAGAEPMMGFAERISKALLADKTFQKGVVSRLIDKVFPRDEEKALEEAYHNASAVLVRRKDTDEWYLVGIYSNKFIDRDGEIIPFDAHQEYAEWTKEVGFRPVITLLHQPKMPAEFWQKAIDAYQNDGKQLNAIVQTVYEQTGIADVERIIPVNGFVAYVAKVRPEKYEAAQQLEKQKRSLGMSHGFVLLSKDDNILAKYRSFELSYLPHHMIRHLPHPVSMAYDP